MFHLGSLVSDYRSRNTRSGGATGSTAPSSSDSPTHSIAMPGSSAGSHARPPLFGLAPPPLSHAAPTRLHAPAAQPRSPPCSYSMRTILAGIALVAIVVFSVAARTGARIDHEAHASVQSGTSLDWYSSPPLLSDSAFRFSATGSIENGTWVSGFTRAGDEGDTVAASPWHDIPLVVSLGGGGDDHAARALHFVCEIPRFTRAKFEVDKADAANRIRQDRDPATGAPRINSYGDYFFNYGMLPQTFEDPAVVAPGTQYFGDGDPIDALELGSRQLSVGSLVAVKPLGAIALIDGGAMDWKILVIRLDDPLAHLMNDVHDIETHLTGAIAALRTYFADYKLGATGRRNQFAFGGAAVSRARAVEAVREAHRQWNASFRRRATLASAAAPAPAPV